jgi:hypothetical protein
MDLEEAKATIRNDSAGHAQWALAAAILCEETESEKPLSDETLRDLLTCLKRRGQAMNTAICALYGRTGRRWPSDPSRYSLDPVDWEEFLRGKGHAV